MWPVSNFFGDYLMAVIIGSVMFAMFAFSSRRLHNFLYMLRVKRAVHSIKILEINNELESQQACTSLKSHCQDLSALGFDCEWVFANGKRKPVALLQLATVHGLCCLFRLNVLSKIPSELEELLLDSSIIKLGVCPQGDSKYLHKDYNVQVHSTLDLRYMYPKRGGLAAMAASEIGVKLDKNWRIKCSNWEAITLTKSQQNYAAKDAFVAIEIFKKWLLEKNKSFLLEKTKINYNSLFNEDLKSEISKYLDINFKESISDPSVKPVKKSVFPGLIQKKGICSYLTRRSPLYHNCFMYAPDGELLCYCDKRKAEWYVKRGLAETLPDEPYSIRLLFEPAARSGDTNGGRFDQQVRENHCVVCGLQQSYLKHYVVPREYRRYFPNYMKDHQSHDIVLMCVKCHHLAALHNDNLRQKLATLCDAPVTATKETQNKAIKKVKDSAKALLHAGDVIPQERKNYLENEIKKYYKVDTLTPNLLEEAASLESRILNLKYESHGSKVVNYFSQSEGGLTKLEKLWREHFLDTMKPQHLPILWSVNHKN